MIGATKNGDAKNERKKKPRNVEKPSASGNASKKTHGLRNEKRNAYAKKSRNKRWKRVSQKNQIRGVGSDRAEEAEAMPRQDDPQVPAPRVDLRPRSLRYVRNRRCQGRRGRSMPRSGEAMTRSRIIPTLLWAVVGGFIGMGVVCFGWIKMLAVLGVFIAVTVLVYIGMWLAVRT